MGDDAVHFRSQGSLKTDQTVLDHHAPGRAPIPEVGTGESVRMLYQARNPLGSPGSRHQLEVHPRWMQLLPSYPLSTWRAHS